jgi:hypothetical protein
VPIRRLFQLLYQAVTAAKGKNANFKDLTPYIAPYFDAAISGYERRCSTCIPIIMVDNDCQS